MHNDSAAPRHGASQEQRFQGLFKQAPVSIQILAPDGCTLAVNKAWEDLFQLHEGHPVRDMFLNGELNVLTDPQLVESGVTAYLRRAMAGESVEIPPIRFDVALLDGPAHARWIKARAHPIMDEHGAVVEVMLMHEDITERVEAEAALRVREERFRSLVMATSQIVWTTTPDGRVQEDSPSWRAFTGQSFEEGRDFGWLNALHPDDLERARSLWGACVAARTVFETEYRLRRADGEYRWMAVRSVPIADDSGAVREWIGANTDIHEKVMAQAGLAQRLEREKRNSALLAKVAQASRTLHTALSSQEIAEALVEEVRAILEVHQAGVSLSGREHAQQAVKAVSRAASANPAGESAPLRARLAVPLVDRKGNNIGMIEVWDKFQGGFTDEDEAILVQLASIAANGFENAGLVDSLREQDRRKDAFLAMLAQELRTPLAPIAAAMESLSVSAAGDARVRAARDAIGGQVTRLNALADDLLDVSRVTRGQIQLERARVEVGVVIAAAVEQVRPLVEERGHVLVVEQQAGGVAVIGDARRLVQAIVNLLDNAARYTPHGGRIVVSVTRQAPAVRIAVRDDGAGIEAGLLPHVFELFTRGDGMPAGLEVGLGIGLALVRNIVMLHGGTVATYSQGAGKGSVFTVNLATAPD